MTNPSRSRSKGREARSGSSLRRLRAFMAENPPSPIATIPASQPPARKISASPNLMVRQDSPIALFDVAQAVTMHMLGPRRSNSIEMSPLAMLLINMASGLISMEYDLRGPNMCIVTACATSNNAIGESWRTIKFGDADIFLAGGSEAGIVAIGLAGFSAMKALSLRNDEPERASRPFDRDRDGFVMGEGAGIVVVEELEHAKARGAKIYCELTGYGLSADAYHMTAPPPDGEGAARAMQLALEHARLSPDQVDYINAHATSTA